MSRLTAQSCDPTADKWSDALSPRWISLILLFGAPPPHPDSDEPYSIHEYADFIHDLALWTDICRVQYMKWEGIKDPEWGESYNRSKRLAFSNDFINWAYTLKREDY